MSNIITTTERLLIREIEDEDQDYVFQLSQESYISSLMPKGEEFDEIRRKIDWEETNDPNTYNGMIFLKDSLDFVGKICMQCIDTPLPEVGLDILKVHQNHGYGPEAITAFCNWYGETHGLKEVKGRIRKRNTHSIHVVEKLGAEYIASTPFFSEEALNLIREALPEEDISGFSKSTVREYILHLPIKMES